ncbi:hypothetical protein CEY16_12505 [Halalkalibacillus sediminis]|uniref:Uncharacterized protein n=1 Tax=Halalkalibacillus sediminis TaxID=2018042 RepID=A0A2I0QRD8_9BACI|nr:hypothetical protein CEY16_12505 [Halalkalibacillus sediminis]
MLYINVAIKIAESILDRQKVTTDSKQDRKNMIEVILMLNISLRKLDELNLEKIWTCLNRKKLTKMVGCKKMAGIYKINEIKLVKRSGNNMASTHLI